MKQILLIIMACLGWLTATAQTFFVETKQLPIRQYNVLEKKLHSQRLPDEDITVVGAEFTLGPQQRYARVKVAVRPRPVVKYTYSLPDSVVRAIQIEVDSLNYLGDIYKATTAYREAPGRYQQFLRAYARIKQEMETQLGKPASSQPAHKNTSALGEYYEQAASWDTPALRADLFLIFTVSAKAPITSLNGFSVSASDTYRIRATISYKNQSRE